LNLGRRRIPLSKPEIRGLRKSVPFWKILGEKGIFSTILRVPITFPPEKFKGHLLSGMCAPDLKGSQGTFAFFTSDPAKTSKPEGGVIVPVKVEGGRVEAFLSGPENSLLRRPVELKLPLKVTVERGQEEARVEISGRTFVLKKGEFSPWIRLTFRPGLGTKIRATAKFLLRSLEPHFEMYVTPLNIDPEKPALPISHPFIYAVYLAKLLGSYITLGEANDTWALNEGALDEASFLELTYANHREWEKMLENALAKTRRGLVVCVFETTDSISHMFWRYLEKGHPASASGPQTASVRVLEDLFIKMDEMVGRMRAKTSPGAALFIMSDHGFKAFRRGVNLNTWLRENGYLVLKDGADGSGEWFKDVDWPNTRAYALGLGGIYINQRGREAQGAVAAGAEAKTLRAELQAKLTGLNDGETGGAAINRVFDKDDIYRGPYKDNAPDLIVGYNAGYRASWASVTGSLSPRVFEDNTKRWSGDHCIDPACVPGVLFSSLKLRTLTPSIMDLAPTVLELFGLPKPPHMDGTSLLAAGPAVSAPQPRPAKPRPDRKRNKR
ncbi:MAG: nucleotide pyrophosphatase, partial [Candidatus Aminicenantes bacterium]|nr:nucleotide pyrophosphatase [Candidatus Aminicenantes bacterium]